MSLTYRDQVYLIPPAHRPDRSNRADDLDHGIGRSPRFAPGWWLTGVAVFYAAVALFCIFVL
ncbi:MAG TPA: hypothetical protein VGM68_02290 [Rhizomicrobium sp.]|jgi:hypothetical protein